MKTLLGIGSSFSMSASPCAVSSACRGKQQTKENAAIAKGFTSDMDTPEIPLLQGGCCD
jgi:hypothetical protein